MFPGTDFEISRLGFGTSNLMARIDRRQSLRLLAVAYDAGITHFDTARLYGYGAAEGVLGEFISAHRNSVTVASKVGILPPRQSPHLLNVAKHVARSLIRFCPGFRASIRSRAESLTRSGVFDVPSMQRSLQASLRELRTDYLDILLLHDCTMTDLTRPEVLDFLQRNKVAGNIRYYGVASSAEVCSLAGPHPVAQVVQFPSNAVTRTAESIAPSGSGVAAITHSSLGTTFVEICQRLAVDDNLARSWSKCIQIDARDRSALAAVFLAYATEANPLGCVLFSSNSEANIRRNGISALESDVNTAKIDALLTCIARQSDTSTSTMGDFLIGDT